jgi:hypothetical protein
MLGTDKVMELINFNPVFDTAFAITVNETDKAIILAVDVINN